MLSLIFNLHFKEFLLDVFQASQQRLHFLFVPNKCYGQHFFMSNYCIFHLLHHPSECDVYNLEVLLQSLQSLPYFPLLYLGLFQLWLKLMEFFIQLSLSKHKTWIFLFPFLFMGFKFKGINMVFSLLSLI